MGIYNFKSDDAFAFVRAQGVRAKIKNGELHLYDCPYCHGASHNIEKHGKSWNMKHIGFLVTLPDKRQRPLLIPCLVHTPLNLRAGSLTACIVFPLFQFQDSPSHF